MGLVPLLLLRAYLCAAHQDVADLAHVPEPELCRPVWDHFKEYLHLVPEPDRKRFEGTFGPKSPIELNTSRRIVFLEWVKTPPRLLFFFYVATDCKSLTPNLLWSTWKGRLAVP